MSSPELSPARDMDRSRSRSAPMEEANGRSVTPDAKSLSPARSPLDDNSPRLAREDSRSPVRSPRDISPARRSLSPENARDLSRSPLRRERSRSRPLRGDSRDPPRRRSLSREPRRRSPSPAYRRRSPSREYRRRSPSPYARRARSPYARDQYRRSPPPRRGYSPYGRRRSPPRRGYSPPRFRGSGRRATPPSRGLHMFVAGLNFITNERELEDRFSRYGAVREARIVRNPRTGESRGFGFVMMEAEDDVDQAIRHLDGRDWNGRRLLVERARNVK